jgi:hypothetical protein
MQSRYRSFYTVDLSLIVIRQERVASIDMTSPTFFVVASISLVLLITLLRSLNDYRQDHAAIMASSIAVAFIPSLVWNRELFTSTLILLPWTAVVGVLICEVHLTLLYLQSLVHPISRRGAKLLTRSAQLME